MMFKMGTIANLRIRNFIKADGSRGGRLFKSSLLQERVSFYSHTWHRLGTKSLLCDTIESITRIDSKYLLGENVSTASISQRMSWASRRSTSRTEDIAYCLLGLFDVNMPLIYGEGRKAFQRLQEAVMKAYPEDHTLYAWGEVVSRLSFPIADDQLWGRKPLPWRRSEERHELLGLLASSPKDFKNSQLFVPSQRAAEFYRNRNIRAPFPVQTGNGIVHLELPILHHNDQAIYCWDNPRIAQLRRLD